MANLLGKKVLEVADEFKKNKLDGEKFIDYYAKYLDENFYIERINPNKIINFIDTEMEEISELSITEQNKKIENLSNDIKKLLIEKDLLKSPLLFDGLYFLALTMIGRIK